MADFILAIDQGTTSSRAILFDRALSPVATAQEEFRQMFPRSGWVEHNPEEIWDTTVTTCRAAIDRAGVAARDIAAIGITNQRETTIIWDRETGKPIHNAIVWQDRRTAETCARLKAEGHEALVSERTGLLLDPYFSATKIGWILDNVDGARQRAEAGELAFGTVDCFLIWRLTGGKVHATDATNASRTMLLNIHSGEWDEELLNIFNIPRAILPDVLDSAGDFGSTDPAILGLALPIQGVAGDQQAASVGQGCFAPGMMKSTYGTGCFALLNTGADPVTSTNRLLTTIACQIGGKRTYALEGSIFSAGAVVQWLRDGLGVIDSAAETEALAAKADPEQRIFMVPAFTGLGAPYWEPDARGAIFGITRGTGPAELARAALESVVFQTQDLLRAMQADWSEGDAGTSLRVDGGLSENNWAMQELADQLGVEVARPKVTETTALGAAYLAGLSVGMYPEPDEFAKSWAVDRRFLPERGEQERAERYAGWQDAVGRVIG